MISCVSKKLQKKITAEKIYISSLFKKNLKYAKSLNPDLILILSATINLPLFVLESFGNKTTVYFQARSIKN